jgi:hypothetical protein
MVGTNSLETSSLFIDSTSKMLMCTMKTVPSQFWRSQALVKWYIQQLFRDTLKKEGFTLANECK